MQPKNEDGHYFRKLPFTNQAITGSTAAPAKNPELERIGPRQDGGIGTQLVGGEVRTRHPLFWPTSQAGLLEIVIATIVAAERCDYRSSKPRLEKVGQAFSQPVGIYGFTDLGIVKQERLAPSAQR